MYSDAEAEEFLCSMLGGSCDLDPAVVKDVFGHSGYDVEKALDALLDLCDSTSNRSTKKMYGDHEERAQTERSIHDTLNGGNNNYKPLRGHLVTQSYPSGMKAAHEPSMGHDDRDNARSHESSEMQFLMEYSRGKLNLQQDVLESLFNVPIMSKQESGSMNWKKALKNVEYFAQGFEYNPTSSSIKRDEAEGYKGFRSAADQHREAMKSFYQQAAVAYAKGDRAHASYLSEKGNGFRKLAQTADEKASQAIFEARNKDIRNAVTIDLHGQHVKQAMKLVKVHLLLLAYVPSIKFLRVITGYGTHSIGKGRLKQSVTGLLRKEDIPWSEENPGTLVIEIDRSKKYSFMDVDSDDGTD
ncbi:smr (Small MutS Related) domain-containing protein isoform X2 [Wolffia australiana]